MSFSFANYRPVVCVCSLIPKVIEFVTGGVGSLGQIGTFSIGFIYKLDDKFVVALPIYSKKTNFIFHSSPFYVATF